jgi:hypothetical protein
MSCRWISAAVTVLCLLASGASYPQAADGEQPPAEPPKDPAVLAREKERDLAVLEKEIAEAKQAEAAAEAPDSTTKGKEGTVTLGETKAGYFAEVLAYKTLTGAARDIAAKVSCDADRRVLITDQLDLSQTASLWNLLDLKVRQQELVLDNLDRTHDDKGEKLTESAALTILPALLGAAADVASFFKTNQELYARTFTLNNQALIAEVSGALLAKNCGVALPGLDISSTGNLRERISKLFDQKRALQEKLSSIGKAHQERMDKLEGNDKAVAAVRQQWLGISEKFAAAFKTFDALMETILTPSEADQKSPLEVVALIDSIRAKKDNPLLLFASIVSQGGDVEITTSVWTGGRVSFIGGSVTVFFVTDSKGNLQASDTLPQFQRALYNVRTGVETLRELDGE